MSETEVDIQNIDMPVLFFGLTMLELVLFAFLAMIIMIILQIFFPIWIYLPGTLLLGLGSAGLWKRAKADKPKNYALQLFYWLQEKEVYYPTPDLEQMPLFVEEENVDIIAELEA